jgi:hypothetical protein
VEPRQALAASQRAARCSSKGEGLSLTYIAAVVRTWCPPHQVSGTSSYCQLEPSVEGLVRSRKAVPGRPWFAAFRLYGPLQADFDKSWSPLNIERVTRSEREKNSQGSRTALHPSSRGCFCR